MTTILASAAVVASVLQGAYFTPEAEYNTDANVYRVYNDGGGYIFDYIKNVETFKEHGTLVVINGQCYSACTLYLTLPPEQLCVTSEAVFGFHEAKVKNRRNEAATKYMFNEMPQWAKRMLGRLTPKLVKISGTVAIQNGVRECS